MSLNYSSRWIICNEFQSFNAYRNPLGIEDITPPTTWVSEKRQKMSKFSSVWLKYTTNRYKDGYDSPSLFTLNNITDVALHTYDDPDQTVLTLPLFNGYCGFGWGSEIMMWRKF